MSSTYGENLNLSIFGQSHGPAIGMTLDGIPAGLPVDLVKLQEFLNRRAPGNNTYSTSRKEKDVPEFLGGIVNGFTCGAPLAAVIRNQNSKSTDYGNLKDSPRPGHADYTAQVKYSGFQDTAGGGHFSGRLTAPLCIAGGLCKQWLELRNIKITARIVSIGDIKDNTPANWIDPDYSHLPVDFPVLDSVAAERMKVAIDQAKSDGDSLAGVIECIISNLPAGLGDPMFGGMESRIAQIVYGIPAVKGLSFGSGFECVSMRGSEHNDSFTIRDGKVVTLTNHAGGILGGITNGMPLVFRVAIKPTPSIARPQKSVSLCTMEEASLFIHGRHDPCIVPRAVPVVEAAAAIAIFDAWLGYFGGKNNGFN